MLGESNVGVVACAVTLDAGNVTVLLDRSNVAFNLSTVIEPAVISAASILPSII